MNNTPTNPKPTSAPGTILDKNAFTDKLVELMMARRTKTQGFVTETELEDLATDCMAVWASPQSEKSSQILHRILNLQHYLAVTGNWSDFLELVGVAPQDWDQSEEGCR